MHDITDDVTVSVGSTVLTPTLFGSVGTWNIMYMSGVSGSGSIYITPVSGTGKFFDFRIYEGNKESSLNYYLKDITSNNGDNICPL